MRRLAPVYVSTVVIVTALLLLVVGNLLNNAWYQSEVRGIIDDYLSLTITVSDEEAVDETGDSFKKAEWAYRLSMRMAESTRDSRRLAVVAVSGTLMLVGVVLRWGGSGAWQTSRSSRTV